VLGKQMVSGRCCKLKCLVFVLATCFLLSWYLREATVTLCIRLQGGKWTPLPKVACSVRRVLCRGFEGWQPRLWGQPWTWRFKARLCLGPGAPQGLPRTIKWLLRALAPKPYRARSLGRKGPCHWRPSHATCACYSHHACSGIRASLAQLVRA
jgi:hypothetical protein